MPCDPARESRLPPAAVAWIARGEQMSRHRRIVFVTSCPDVWGGSEELWAGSACRLKDRGFDVVAGRTEPWPRGPLHRRWAALRGAGIRVRSFGASRLARVPPAVTEAVAPIAVRPAWRLRSLALAAKLRAMAPRLVVISQWGGYDGMFPICLPEVCRFAGVPYAIICQKASDIHWPPDGLRHIYQRGYREAVAVFFVADHNRRTVERQLSLALPDAEVVRNPFMVQADGPLPWPVASRNVLRLACVARLWPLDKGQDVLLNVLARERWRSRPVEVSFFGHGENARGVEEMARHLALANVRFPGFADPTEIWRTHHALVLPTRAEGTPLAQVEAMMCGRPVIVADAGGTTEIMRDGEHGFIAIAAAEAALDDALERAWQRRDGWPAMGAAAAQHIRTLYPADPCGAFADRLERILGKGD